MINIITSRHILLLLVLINVAYNISCFQLDHDKTHFFMFRKSNVMQEPIRFLYVLLQYLSEELDIHYTD